jgi:RadC-like JAB domain
VDLTTVNHDVFGQGEPRLSREAPHLSHGHQRRTIVVDQLTLGMDAEPTHRMARHRAHPAQPTATKPPSRYRLIPIARLKVMSPEPGALVAEAGVHGVEARELGYAKDPAAVAAVVGPYFAEVQADQEEFVVLVLNTKLRIVQLIPLFRGGMTSAPVDTKVVLRAVLVAGGAGFVAAHNHPSGDLQPSPEDRHLTKLLSLAAEAIGLRFVDHVIMPDGRPGYFSFAHAGQL